jgi:hypothetical protein
MRVPSCHWVEILHAVIVGSVSSGEVPSVSQFGVLALRPVPGEETYSIAILVIEESRARKMLPMRIKNAIRGGRMRLAHSTADWPRSFYSLLRR